MKNFYLLVCLLASLVLAQPSYGQDVLPSAAGVKKASFRRFNLRDGKTLMAAVLGRTDTSVEFLLESGRKQTVRLNDVSQGDQLFLRRWSVFKESLMSNAEFAQISVKELLGMSGYQSFEFTMRGNHIFTEGEITGHKAVFMIDTGASSTLIHTGSAEKFGITMGEMVPDRVYGIGGKSPAAVCEVSAIKLGDAEILNRKILAADLLTSFGSGGRYDAILGADFLREMDAVISYREGRLFLQPDRFGKPATLANGKQEARSEFRKWTLADGSRPSFHAAIQDRDGDQVVFRFQDKTKRPAPLAIDRLTDEDQVLVRQWSKLRDELIPDPAFKQLTTKELLELRGFQSLAYRLSGNHIILDGSVVGAASEAKVSFLIDTGAHDCVFDLATSKRAVLEMGELVPNKVYGIGGAAAAAETKVTKLTLGEAIITDFKCLSADLYKDQGELATRNYGAIFGSNFLRQLDVVINYKEALLFLRPDISDKPSKNPTP